MKLLIVGSRSITDFDLSPYIPADIDTVISGGAGGIDWYALSVSNQSFLYSSYNNKDYARRNVKSIHSFAFYIKENNIKMRFRRFRRDYEAYADSTAEDYRGSDMSRERSASDTQDKRVSCRSGDVIYDRGNAPYTFNIVDEAEKNTDFRRVIWTGKHFQVVLMSIPQGGEIPFEVHEDNDQFVFITSGQGEVMMDRLENNLSRKQALSADYAIIIPSGTFHIIKNTGRAPLKLYTVYAPKRYPFGTVAPNGN